MKKTIPITIAGSLFYIEEDAYDKLSKYLESIKKHFSSSPESFEIVSDIESRIAEQFLENKKNNEKIVTLKEVEDLIKTMGNVEDFNDQENSGDDKQKEGSGKNVEKKLFRDPDDLIIAGVSSGIAAYLGIDSVLVRLIFVLTIFFGGTGILVYIILWIVMPMAKTSTDKLQMRGEPVTINSVNQMVKDKVEEVKKNKSKFRKIITLPFIILEKVFRFLFPLIRKFISLILIMVSALIMFGLTTAMTIGLFNLHSPYVDFPLLHINHSILVYLGIISSFLLVIIPMFFILIFGICIWKKRNILKSAVGFSLLGIWGLSAIALGTVSTKIVPEYKTLIEIDPQYAKVSQNFELSGFNTIESNGWQRISIIEGPEFQVSVIGYPRDIDNLTMNSSEGILKIDTQEESKICVFCQSTRPEITIQMPEIKKIVAQNGSKINIETASSTDLYFKVTKGSEIKLSGNLKYLEAELERDSSATLEGKSQKALITLSEWSRVNAEKFEVKDLIVKTMDLSRAKVRAINTLNIESDNESLVEYFGNPKVTGQFASSTSRFFDKNEEW